MASARESGGLRTCFALIAALIQDYFVSYKPFELQDAQTRYSESLVTFSDFVPYRKPAVPSHVGSREDVLTRLQLGNVTDGTTPLFVCLQSLSKLTPAFDAMAADILRQSPHSLLLLKAFRNDNISQRFVARIRRTMGDVAHRVMLLDALSPQDWFGLLRHGDVVLDSWPVGGFTTSLEAFAAGTTPIVTLPHEAMVGATGFRAPL